MDQRRMHYLDLLNTGPDCLLRSVRAVVPLVGEPVFR